MKENNFYPLGVAYYRPPTPEKKYWEKDLEKISNAGFNIIRLNGFWSWMEPKEGQFDFSDFDQLSELANKYKLKILLTLYMVSMPAWIYEKYPDCRFVSASGLVFGPDAFPDVPCGGWPGLCFDADKVRQQSELFIKKITEHYRGNPTIFAFDFQHEPSDEPAQAYFIDNWRDKLFCYCPHTINKFRNWLREKHGSINHLNQVWGRKYTDWEQVNPPKIFGVYADWFDWRNFSIEALGDEIFWGVNTIKKYDPERMVVAHSCIMSYAHPFFNSIDDFKFSQLVDLYGASIYNFNNPVITAARCDMLRSASKNGAFWVSETSGGSGPMFLYIGDPEEKWNEFGLTMSAQDITRHAWENISHGAKGIIYWMWRPEIFGGETAAMGFTNRDGSLNERVEAAGNMFKLIMKNEDLFLNSVAPKSEVAILFNTDNFIQEGIISLFKTLGKQQNEMDSLLGFYNFLWRENIPVDFISKDQALDGGLEKYKLLILPYSINVSQLLGDKIKEFVEKGGFLISEALCGFFTDQGLGSEVTPGSGLEEVFNCKINSYKMVQECKVKFESSNQFIDLNRPVLGSQIQEVIEVNNKGKVLGTFDDASPAVIYGKYGSGRSIYIGTLISLNQLKSNDTTTQELVNKILLLANIKKPIEILPDDKDHFVEARLLKEKDQFLLFLISHCSSDISSQLSFTATKDQYESVDLINGKEIPFKQVKEEIKFNFSLEPYAVKIIRFSQIN